MSHRAPSLVIAGTMLMLALSGCLGIRGNLFAEPGDEHPPRLRFNGYYYTTDGRMYPGSTGSVIDSIILWEDGSAASLPSIGKPIGGYSQFPPQYGTFEEAREKVQDWIRNLTGRSGDGGTAWGNFLVEGDTIRIRVLVPSGNSSFYSSTVVEYKGIILSDTSFIIITPYLPPGSNRSVPRNWTFHLQPFDGIPPSDNWTHRLWKKE